MKWQAWDCSMLITIFLATGASQCFVIIICCFEDVEVSVCSSFLSRRSLFLWCWLNGRLPPCRRILFPDIRNAATFSLPIFTWLTVTVDHGAAWCHLQALPFQTRPCNFLIRNDHGAMNVSLFHSNTQGIERKVKRLGTLMIILHSMHSFLVEVKRSIHYFHKKVP